MDIHQEVEEIKKELVELIIAHLRENKIDEAKARQLAADFLAVLPIGTEQELLQKLKTLGQTYPEAQALYVRELKVIRDKQQDVALNKMRDYIHQGNMEQAITVAKSFAEGVI